MTATMPTGSFSVTVLEVLVLAAARRFAVIVAVVALAACDDGPLDPSLSLFLAHARWERANVDSYEITVQRLCFCPSVDPVRITVSGGVIVSRVNVVTNEPLPDNRAASFPDVPGLFAIVKEARDNADHFEVDFDATYGFPTLISIDWETNTADDEVVYRMENFAVGSE